MNHSHTSRWIWAASLLLACAAAPSRADAQGPADSASVHELTLEERPEIRNGRIAMVEGVAGPEGVRLMVGKLSILQPVAVTLVSSQPQDDLRLSLWKYAEPAVAREGSTRGSGLLTFQFRTEDDLQLRIVSPGGPRPYRLAVWAGDEVEPAVASPFVPQSRFRGESAGARGAAETGGSSQLVLWVLAAGLFAVAGLLLILVLRRGRA